MQSQSRNGLVVILAAFLLISSHAQSTFGQELSAKAVQKAIDKGIGFLRGQQEVHSMAGGIEALKALAMLNAGVPPNDKEVKKLINRIVNLGQARNVSNYVISLRIMVLAAADPEGKVFTRQIRKDVQTLVNSQVKAGKNMGGWSYQGFGAGGADASNSQFSLLALHEAGLVGVEVDQEVWLRAAEYWKNCFVPNEGGFSYFVGGRDIKGSMTCAGISSFVIIDENLQAKNGLIENGNVVCCGQGGRSKYIRAASRWLGDNFTVRANPKPRRGADRNTKFYYLYALERAGRLSGERFFGEYDWYREGAQQLLKDQILSGAWQGNNGLYENVESIATAFAILFLSKGKRPVVFGKLQHSGGEDWDQHPKGVHQLTKNLETSWRMKLNWQTVRRNATTNDMLEARVLVISGRNQLDLTDREKVALKKYVESGGFILAEACQGDGCGDNVRFDQEFRILMKELFPESNLEPLPKDHPIWTAQNKLIPDPEFPLLGLQACCRTSVVFCRRALSARWQVDRKGLRRLLNPKSEEQVQWCTDLGVNIAAYATGRQLRDKLDIPKVDQGKSVLTLNERVLVLPKLDHGGGADDAPNAWRNILQEAERVGLRIKLQKKMINANLEELIDHPFLFMHGRDAFFFSDEEREALKLYLERGGFILADAICASQPFADSFKKEMSQIFPGSEFKLIPPDHPLWTDPKFGFPLDRVTLRRPDPNRGGFAELKIPPKMEALIVNDQIKVIFSPYDLSCAMENVAASQCEGYLRDDAAIMAIKILFYVLRRTADNM